MTYRLIDYRQPLENLQQWNRKPEVVEKHAVPSGSDPEQAYVVRRLECLRVPFEVADVVDDQVELWVCSCPDTRYRRWPEKEPDEITSVPSCKHVNQHFKSVKAQSDENQSELPDTPVGDK